MTKEQYADLQATIFDFQKKIMMYDIASMDPEVRAAMESVEAQLDALNGWPVASSVAVWPVKFCQRITAMST